MSGVTPDAAAIVLAGGASRRFGGDKLRADLRGEPLLAHAVRRMVEVTAEVHVVTSRDDPLPTLPADLGVDFIRDVVEYEGPLRATARGLAFVERSWSIVVGGDMPELQPAVMTTLLRLAEERDAGAAALGEGARFRPLPCVLRTDPARAEAAALLSKGERSLRALLTNLSVAILDEEAWLPLDPERRSLLDVDEPDDLDRASDL
ncbi:MAG TPA: molybdenum cofactor guanylyltransferase [Actinomycetota bacterium]|nr:molybdenum cofactor guanylyltransferase [Actinomycetota bacterium]